MRRDYAAIFQKRLQKKLPWLKAMKQYKGMKDKTLFIYTILTRPNNLVNKARSGCSECTQLSKKLSNVQEILK
ncbi:hypothetical protein CREGCYN_16010 [Synechococcus sp. M16CYN]